jgi:hypothetical protein
VEIPGLNPLLRGRGSYFRTGNAGAKFRQLTTTWYTCSAA